MQGIVFIGSGKIAFGKLSQALDYGALTLQIEGDFDACLQRVRQVADKLGRPQSFVAKYEGGDLMQVRQGISRYGRGVIVPSCPCASGMQNISRCRSPSFI